MNQIMKRICISKHRLFAAAAASTDIQKIDTKIMTIDELEK